MLLLAFEMGQCRLHLLLPINTLTRDRGPSTLRVYIHFMLLRQPYTSPPPDARPDPVTIAMSKVPPSQADTEDLNNPKLNVSCLDFLLIELVPLAQRITDQLHAREQALVDEFKRSKIFHKDAVVANTPKGQERESNAPTVTVTDGTSASSVKDSSTADGMRSTALGAATVMDDETREAVFWRLDGLGYRVGQGLVER